MNKNDFLDILKDYLKGHFANHEINDIARDYEEFFLNGELEGKSEQQVIESLGSPKAIATELIMEINPEGTPSNGAFKSRVDFKSMGRRVKSLTKKACDKCCSFLNSSEIMEGKFPGWAVKAVIILFTLCIFPFALSAIGFVVMGFVGVVLGSIAALLGLVFSFVTIPTDITMGWFIFFISIIGIGFAVFIWTMLINIASFLKYIIQNYVSWVKTRFMYIRVKKKKDMSCSREDTLDDDISDKDTQEEGNKHE
ncbi:MAG: DUF1700 domain-containing protein [Clostridium sp.]